MVSPVLQLVPVTRFTTVHNRGREVVRSPESPASEFVNDACVLNVYGSALLALAHGREKNPVTIHRLDYQSPVNLSVNSNPLLPDWNG